MEARLWALIIISSYFNRPAHHKKIIKPNARQHQCKCTTSILVLHSCRFSSIALTVEQNCDNLPPKDALTAFLMEFYPLDILCGWIFLSLFCRYSQFPSFFQHSIYVNMPRFFFTRCSFQCEENLRTTCRSQLTKMTSMSLEMISLEILNKGIKEKWYPINEPFT